MSSNNKNEYNEYNELNDENIENYLKDLQLTTVELTKLSQKFLPTDENSLELSFNKSYQSKLNETKLDLIETLNDFISAGYKNYNEDERPRLLQDEDDIIDNSKPLINDIVDQLLEDADINIDKALGKFTKPSIQQSKQQQPLQSRLMNDKFLKRPQFDFNSRLDNDPYTPWKPILQNKVNAKSPLNWKTIRDENNVEKLANPYTDEVNSIKYPKSLFKISEPLKQLDFDQTPFTWVSNNEQLDSLLIKLNKSKEIAIDLEHHDFRSYYGFVCLMQISIRGEDFIIDTLKLRAELIKLNEPFTNPNIIKVLHGAESDIVWLQRDFGIYIVNLFDTFHATKVLGHSAHSLSSLLSTYCNFEADKRYQRADWRIRPLPKEMLHYARADTHYLLYIYDILRNTLLERGKKKNTLINDVLKRSENTSLNTYFKDLYDFDHGYGIGGWRNLAIRWNRVVEGTLLEVFRRLHRWRDFLARKEDESVRYILPNHQLYELALKQPKSSTEVIKSLENVTNLIRQRSKEIANIINEGIEFASKHPDQLPSKIIPKSLLRQHNLNLPKMSGLDTDLWNINFDNLRSKPHNTSLSSSTKSRLFGMNTDEISLSNESSLFGKMINDNNDNKNSKKAMKITESFKLSSIIPHYTFGTDFDLDSFDEFKKPIEQKEPPKPARIDEVIKEQMSSSQKNDEDIEMLDENKESKPQLKSKAQQMAEAIPSDAGITGEDLAIVGKQEKKRKRKEKKHSNEEKDEGEGDHKGKYNKREKKSDKPSKKDKKRVIESHDYSKEESVLDKPLDDLSQSTKKPKKQKVKSDIEGKFLRPSAPKISSGKSSTFSK